MTEYAPCPTCGQYSHSIPEDRVAAAFNHFHMMYDPRGDEIPTQHWFDDHTRDHAQVLVAEVECLREKVSGLTVALHDAIRRPMGVVPASADPFYQQDKADAAEARRVAGR